MLINLKLHDVKKDLFYTRNNNFNSSNKTLLTASPHYLARCVKSSDQCIVRYPIAARLKYMLCLNCWRRFLTPHQYPLERLRSERCHVNCPQFLQNLTRYGN